jgi:hypothetical protein
MSSTSTVSVQTGTKISFKQLYRTAIYANQNLENVSVVATDVSGKKFTSPVVSINFTPLFDGAKFDTMTVGVKFFPGYSSSFPVAPSGVRGHGMSYTVEYNAKESETA